jgi:DNA-binding CsgD family transcriptional regulator
VLRKKLHPLTDLTPRRIQTLALLSKGKTYGLFGYQLRLKLGVKAPMGALANEL